MQKEIFRDESTVVSDRRLDFEPLPLKLRADMVEDIVFSSTSWFNFWHDGKTFVALKRLLF